MVKLYFGLPGAGKSTVLTKIVYKHLKARRSPYKYILSNVALGNLPPFDKVTIFDPNDIGKYDYSDSLIVIDEASLYFDSRSYKTFRKDTIAYFLMHRHHNNDFILATQQWDAVDKKIRVITDRVYYIYKGKWLGSWFSNYYRVPYDIIIPDPKKGVGDKLGDIVQGYAKPPFLFRLFCHRVYRPKYYKYFDSFDRLKLPQPPHPMVLVHSPIQKKFSFIRRKKDNIPPPPVQSV